jgi:hypothetical protein
MERPNAAARGGANSVLQRGEDWRSARKAYDELQLLGLPCANLLLVGADGAIRIVLDMLWLELREPIVRWRPGEQFELPSPGHAATLVLDDVSELTYAEQHSLLRWLEQTDGQIRVVSTTTKPLWPRVKTGAFSDMLYYRLNTVYVEVKG